VSVGVASRRTKDDSVAQLLDFTDKAMYPAIDRWPLRVLANFDVTPLADERVNVTQINVASYAQ
jgi:hypothetical protein